MTKPAISQLKEELEQLKRYLNYTINKAQALEAKLNGLEKSEPVEQQDLRPSIEPVIQKQKTNQPKNLESAVGKYWLNRIGIGVFTLGIAFLVSYAFKYFGPFARIIFSYAVGSSFFLAGASLSKKEKFINYGRALLGGAWAITYFTTYAMYHFQASRLINSQLLDLILLAIVSCGMMIHALRYKSEELFSIAVFVGYLTATIGYINYFTFISCSLLALIVVLLVYKLQWIRLILVGIVCTYFVHFFWVFKQIYDSPSSWAGQANSHFLINSGFLLLYWSIFIFGLHLLKSRDLADRQKISMANLSNFIIFFFMAYPQFSRFYPEYRFHSFLILGIVYLVFALVMESRNRHDLSTSDFTIALLLLTLCIPLKFLPYSTSVIWLVELPFLIYLGLIFERRLFRYFALGLALCLLVKIFLFDIDNSWNKIISFIAFLSMSASYFIARFSPVAKAIHDPAEKKSLHLLSFSAVSYLVAFTFLALDSGYISLALSLEVLFISILGNLAAERSFRVYALGLTFIIFFKFAFDDYDFLYWQKWPVLLSQAVAIYASYFLSLAKNKEGQVSEIISKIFFTLATAFFTWIVYRYCPAHWISLGLGIEGILLFGCGFMAKDKNFRVAGFAVFALTLLRIILVDLSMLAVIYKIASFIILGIIFLGVSFIYNKYNIGKSEG